MSVGLQEQHGSILDEKYRISEIVPWINNLNAKCVALQFPDELLADAPSVALELEQGCKAQIYIIGDTSYGSCCIDEISALRVDAEAVVHFGKACLSQNDRLPVLYIFETIRVEPEPFLSSFRSVFDAEDQILIASDFRYHQSVNQLVISLSTEYKHLVYFKPNFPNQLDESAKCNVFLCGRRCYLSPGGRVLVCYIGDEDCPTLANLMLTLNHYTFFSYSTKTLCLQRESTDVNRQLRKRYYLVEKARDSKLIGILVATLGVTGYMEIIDRIKHLIRGAGKKYYTFVMGKLSPSKLANFPEIDLFVIVSCPENSLLNSKDFYRPVITPFELESALNVGCRWTGEYITDFKQILQSGPLVKENVDFCSEHSAGVSLITGRTQRCGLVDTDGELEQQAYKKLESDSEPQRLDTLPLASAFFRQNREWHGLEPHCGETPIPTLATAGKSGLASGYLSEFGDKCCSDQ